MASISPSEQCVADIRHELRMLNAHLDILIVRSYLASMRESLAALVVV